MSGPLYARATPAPAEIYPVTAETLAKVRTRLTARSQWIFVDVLKCLYEQPLVLERLIPAEKPDRMQPDLQQVRAGDLTESQVLENQRIRS